MVRMIRRQEDNVGQEKGAILVLTAFAMILLLGIAALVVDIVILQQARIRAQATADSSALAAVQDLDVVSNATAVAQEYALRNYNVAIGDWAGCTDSGALAESTGVDCISVNTASDLKFIRVRLPDREVSTFFAPLLGIDAFSVSATATAEVEYLSGPPGIPTTGDADPADFQEVANFLREGKLGSDTFDDCPNEPPANWLDVNPPNTYTDDQGKPAKWGEYIFVFENVNTGG
jgi:Putative Flp pilus-assembly TadE/G-like